jgi:hypothetical protein
MCLVNADRYFNGHEYYVDLYSSTSWLKSQVLTELGVYAKVANSFENPDPDAESFPLCGEFPDLASVPGFFILLAPLREGRGE